MKTSKLFVLAILGLMLFSASSAQAVLRAVSATNPATGFPNFYVDTNGVRLGLCTSPIHCTIDPTGVEQFYYSLSAVTARATVVLALEATYLNGAVIPGEEVVFARERIRITNLPRPGVYTVQHPYGTRVFRVRPNAKGINEINFTSDIGVAPGAFRVALRGRIGPFLKQIPAPPGFMGSAVFNRPITPGPGGALLTVTGPTGVVVNQRLWAVEGQRF